MSRTRLGVRSCCRSRAQGGARSWVGLARRRLWSLPATGPARRDLIWGLRSPSLAALLRAGSQVPGRSPPTSSTARILREVSRSIPPSLFSPPPPSPSSPPPLLPRCGWVLCCLWCVHGYVRPLGREFTQGPQFAWRPSFFPGVR